MGKALGPHQWVLSTPATSQSHWSSQQSGAGPVVSLHLFFPLISRNPSGVCRWLCQGDLQLACCQKCIRHSIILLERGPKIRALDCSSCLWGVLGGKGRWMDGAVQSSGEQNPCEFSCFPFPGLIQSCQTQPRASVFSTRDVGLTPCLYLGCCGRVRKRMETSPEGKTGFS